MSSWDDEIEWQRISAGRYVEPTTGMEIQRVKNFWLALTPVRSGGLDPAGRSGTLAVAKRHAAVDVKIRRAVIDRAHTAADQINQGLATTAPSLSESGGAS